MLQIWERQQNIEFIYSITCLSPNLRENLPHANVKQTQAWLETSSIVHTGLIPILAEGNRDVISVFPGGTLNIGQFITSLKKIISKFRLTC